MIINYPKQKEIKNLERFRQIYHQHFIIQTTLVSNEKDDGGWFKNDELAINFHI